MKKIREAPGAALFLSGNFIFSFMPQLTKQSTIILYILSTLSFDKSWKSENNHQSCTKFFYLFQTWEQCFTSDLDVCN